MHKHLLLFYFAVTGSKILIRQSDGLSGIAGLDGDASLRGADPAPRLRASSPASFYLAVTGSKILIRQSGGLSGIAGLDGDASLRGADPAPRLRASSPTHIFIHKNPGTVLNGLHPGTFLQFSHQLAVVLHQLEFGIRGDAMVGTGNVAAQIHEGL